MNDIQRGAVRINTVPTMIRRKSPNIMIVIVHGFIPSIYFS